VTQTITIVIEDAVLLLEITSQPNDLTEAGNPIGIVSARVVTEAGAPADWYNGQVTIRITEGTGGIEAADARVFGSTQQQANAGIVTFDDLFITRAGEAYTLTLSADEVADAVSDAFTIKPGPPLRLNIVNISGSGGFTTAGASQNPSLSAVDAGTPKPVNSFGIFNADTPLRGSRLILRLVITDTYFNPTVIEEGDTKVRLQTTSQTGNFFMGQTDTEAVPEFTIPARSSSLVIFYEDPTTGEPELVGVPTPPTGAPEVLPAQQQVRIRTADRLVALPESITTEVNERERISLFLVDTNGEPVNAPFPGVLVNLTTPSETGKFFADSVNGQTVNTVFISPSVTRTNLYYSDSELGSYRLVLNGVGVPSAEAFVQVNLLPGVVDLNQSTVSVSDGFVNMPNPVTITLVDRNGIALTGRAASIRVRIANGPNSGAEFASLVESEDTPGVYTTSYLPTQEGVDQILVSYDDVLFANAPFTSSVISDGPAEISILAGNNQEGVILTALTEELTVRITNALGQPVPNITVRYQLSGRPDGATGSVIRQRVVLTDSDGVASTGFTPGNKVGTYQISASVIGLDPVLLNVQAITCPVNSADDLSGSCAPYRYELMVNTITPRVGESVILSAQLTDKHGNKVALSGLDVSWSADKAGSFVQSPTLTNAQGQASTVYTPTEIAGLTHKITATDSGNRSGESAEITVLGGVLAGFTITGVDTARVNTTTQTYELILYDEFENEMVLPEVLAFRIGLDESLGLAVLSGRDPLNLNLSSLQRVTIPAGQSRGYFQLRQNRAGLRVISAEQVVGISRITGETKRVYFLPGDAETLSMQGGDQQSARVGTLLEKPLSVLIQDAFGNAVPEVPVTFEVIQSPLGTLKNGIFFSLNNVVFQTGIANVRTDSTGLAKVLKSMGEKSGKYVVSAKTDAIAQEVLFELDAIPGQFALNQNYPNPFNPTTTILYEVPSESFVTISLYNTLGQRVSTLVQENRTAGVYTINLDMGRLGLASGVYIYHMSAEGLDTNVSFTKTQKLLFVK
jgi:hypothetical protein